MKTYTHTNPSWSKNEPGYVTTIEIESAHVDPQAFIAKDAHVGAGAWVKAGAVVGAGARVGARALVEVGAHVEARAWVKAGAYVEADAVIYGPKNIHACRRNAQGEIAVSAPAVHDLLEFHLGHSYCCRCGLPVPHERGLYTSARLTPSPFKHVHTVGSRRIYPQPVDDPAGDDVAE